MKEIDAHRDGAALVTLFRITYPSLYAAVKGMCESALGHPLGEGDWIHLVTRITMEHKSKQLQSLNKEAKEILPRLQSKEAGPVGGKSDWLSDDFDQFGFFIAREL
jgi:hypothetical protein